MEAILGTTVSVAKATLHSLLLISLMWTTGSMYVSMNQQFAQIDQRFDEAREERSRIQSDIASLRERMARVESKVDNLERRMGQMESALQSTSGAVRSFTLLFLRAWRTRHEIRDGQARVY